VPRPIEPVDRLASVDAIRRQTQVDRQIAQKKKDPPSQGATDRAPSEHHVPAVYFAASFPTSSRRRLLQLFPTSPLEDVISPNFPAPRLQGSSHRTTRLFRRLRRRRQHHGHGLSAEPVHLHEPDNNRPRLEVSAQTK
jgi:hypothetical protein